MANESRSTAGTENSTRPKVVGIILAGGSGDRFEADVPKQFCMLNGRPVIQHSVATFRESGLFSTIVVVLPKEWIGNPDVAIGDINVLGGRTRNESTWNALQVCDPDTDFVLTHDAARPFVTRQILTDSVEALREHDAVDVCIAADDTIVVAKDGFVESIPDRSRLMRGQTPQGFRFNALYDAYRKSRGAFAATDDVTVYLRAGGTCKIVQGSPFNIKLTYPQDLFIAERILQYRPAREHWTPDLNGKTVLLVGGSGGIGTEVRKLLVAGGAIVHAPTREEFDLSGTELPEPYIRKWDAIIHAAGVISNSNTAEEVDDVFSVNFRSVVLITDLARKAMQDGAIVVVGSSSAMRGRDNIPLYAASKAAVNNFVEGIAPILLRERNVKINCINPGRVETPMIANASIASRALLDPRDVANVILAYTQPLETGQIINIRKYVQ
jgi:2-C-methyl-D-erythritol 4-phosphate cytidylyltransferase